MALPFLLDVNPRIVPPFDPGFRPMILAYRSYHDALRQFGHAVPLRIAIERENGLISTFATELFPEGQENEATVLLSERIVKFLLWGCGGWRIFIQGPQWVGKLIKSHYTAGGLRVFDLRLMSDVYEKGFEVLAVDEADFPSAKESQAFLGGHLDGCRVGFDLGASDYKIAAVREGSLVFSDEIPWNPSEQTDPDYHYRHISEGLKKAAAHLPRVDAIGGSAAGIYIACQVRIASLFRSIPPYDFKARIRDMFRRLQREWNVPFEIINDGEVTALAGTLSLGERAILGIAMGSSEAAGFVTAEGRLSGWLDELAFAPLDLNPKAEMDEWSGDRGVGAMAFSQQAVNKLALAAGLTFPAEVKLAERLKEVQILAEKGDSRALGIFDAIGVYLGYTIPWYGVFYDFKNLLVLGRVMSGIGGNQIIQKAQAVLETEFPEARARVKIHLVDEKSRRVGQAFAAATLPEIKAGRGAP